MSILAGRKYYGARSRKKKRHQTERDSLIILKCSILGENNLTSLRTSLSLSRTILEPNPLNFHIGTLA